MLKKLSILTVAVFLILISACTQKYDAIGPGITDASQQMTEKMILINQVFKANTVSQPKIVISEKFMYVGRQMNLSDTIITSCFLNDFTIPAKDSLLDSIQFQYPLYKFPPDTSNLPYLDIKEIHSKWNSVDDSLIIENRLITKFFKNVRIQKDTTQYAAIKYLLKFSIPKDSLALINKWRLSQDSSDTDKFTGFAFSTNSDSLLKFYSNTHPSEYRPRLINWYHKKDSSIIKFSTKSYIKTSASLVKRRPVFHQDSTMIKIGGVGGEGKLFKINVHDAIPEKAQLLTARFVLKKVDQDPVNGGLSYLKIYNLNDSTNAWQRKGAQTVVDSLIWDKPGTNGGYSYTFSADSNTVYLRDINALIQKWRKKNKDGRYQNYGFYLKAGEGTSGNRLGYTIFRDIAFEVTYLMPNDQ